MPKKIIILGHSGFIGSRLERMLSVSGRWEVIGRSMPEIDLTDQEQVLQLVPYMTPDATLVLAAAVKRQFGDTLEVFRQNMAIIENVCRLLALYPVGRVIFMSSSAVYGEETENRCIREQTPVNPTSYYGINKYTAECLLKKVCADKISLVCLRPPLIYGPGDSGKTYGPAGFVDAAIESQPVTLWGDGTELREFIYIDDICRLIEHLVDHPFVGELNVVSGTPYCFADVIAILKKNVPALAVASRPRSKQKADNAFDNQRIQALLPADFRFTSLETGISAMLEMRA
ncbi:MAG: NAD-dependent epimerase/dehydratase family protein [Nitrosomonadales bacterium]